jgi:hypothetical protein
MTTGHQIKYLQHKEVDKVKWDACITNATNGLIYPYSFYLDCMTKHWDALVLDDYLAVMPLTWNKKYGFHYLYQPAFTASLGVFGKNLTKEMIDDFIKSIPSKFKLIEISLNSGNIFDVSKSFSLLRSNYILQLNKPYEELYKAYRDNHKRNITKAFQAGSKVSKEVAVDEIIRLNKGQLQHIDGTKSEDYRNFKKLYELLKDKQQAKTYAIVEKNKILASAVFLFSHNRAYYIMVGNHPDGKIIGASPALIDAFIKDHSNQNLILDFEGSDIRNLAFFYSGFGATEENYPALRINKLPWYARLLKK